MEKPDYIIVDSYDNRMKLLASATIVSISKNVLTLNNAKNTEYRLANVQVTMPHDNTTQRGTTMIYEKLMDLMEYEKGEELTLLIELDGEYAGYSKVYLAQSAALDVSAFAQFAGVSPKGEAADKPAKFTP
jgi:hypothetical protein